MDVASLRQELAAHLGVDVFRRFVAQSHCAKRLRYWQEGAWRSFVATRPEFDCTFEELRVALRICEAHGRELEPDDLRGVHARVDRTDWYFKVLISQFPNASTGPCPTEMAPFEDTSVLVWYCADCRAAEAAFLALHD